MEFESCILLEPSQQYRNDFLEDIIFQKQLRSELEEIERSNQIQLAINTDAKMDEIIKKAKEQETSIFKRIY